MRQFLHLLITDGPARNTDYFYPFYAAEGTKAQEVEKLLEQLEGRTVIEIREMPHGFRAGQRFYPGWRETREVRSLPHEREGAIITMNIPEELLNRLPPLHKHHEFADPTVYLRFYFPAPRGCEWYAYEGERLASGDFLFFGLIVNEVEQESGYFSLAEMAHTTGPTPDTEARVVSI